MKNYNVYVSSKDTKDRLTCCDLKNFIMDEEKNISNSVKMDISKTYQKILGFGGALT